MLANFMLRVLRLLTPAAMKRLEPYHNGIL